jgi:hypothetical protein
MNDAEHLASLLDEIGWSHRGLADILDVKMTSVLRWLNGDYTVPPELLTWLRLLAEFHRRHPLPEGWRAGAAREARTTKP